MAEIKCICGKDVPQTVGKKKKVYCSPRCRQKDWQDKRRNIFNAVLKQVAKPLPPPTFQSAVMDKKTGNLKVVTHKVAPPPVTVTIQAKSFLTSKEVDNLIRTSGNKTELEAIKDELSRNEMIAPDKKRTFITRIEFKLGRL